MVVKRMKALSIGIIGGADGPTAIFVTASGWGIPAAALGLLAVGIAVVYRLRKKKKEK